jgi:hypothetical protein
VYNVAVDVGGTFTDVLVFDEGSGELTEGKVLSTPDDPSRGVVEGMEAVCEKVGIGFTDLKLLFHGTTVVTNMILTNTGSRVGLLATKGHEQVQMFAGVFLISAVDPTILFNDGYADIIKVNIPDGTVLRPREPAPLSNRLVVMARQFDVLGAVYAKAIGFNVSGSYGTSPNFVYSGVKETGEPFQTMEILYGGIPAIPGKDGLDGHS